MGEKTCQWENEYTNRLIIDNKPILLVPKKIVNYSLDGSSYQYKQHFVLNYLQEENIKNRTSLVRQRKKSKELFVTKKDIVKNEPTMDKDYLSNFTMKYPEIFEKDMLNNSKPMNGNILDTININTVCNILLDKLESIPTESNDASNFHNLMIGIFELLLYPNLIKPKKIRN